ncbi:MAG TPA: hypothetical protein VEU07_10330, partial [Candidatus Acidoferrum sp.]|nr:hypothetical protein [Candidatus Acidoferrum sp.]
SAHLARYDIFVSALGFAAMALACRPHREPADSAEPPRGSIVGDLGAGLCVGAAFEVHPSGCLYGPVVLLLYLVHRPPQRNRVLSFILGNVAALGIYALLHILRYPQTWMTLNRLAGSVTHKPPLATLDPWVILDSLIGTLRLVFYGSPILLPIALLTVIVVVMQNLPEARLLTVSFLSLHVAFALLMQHKLFYYTILISPIIEIAAACLIVRLSRQSWQRILGAVCVMCAATYPLLPLRDDWNQDFWRIKKELPATVRAGETIMGSQTWWFALHDHPWYSWEELLYFQRYQPGSNLEAAFREFRPSVLLVDQHLDSFISEGGPPGSYEEQLRLPRSEMRQIFQKYGHVRAALEGGEYGRIYVIEFDWDKK